MKINTWVACVLAIVCVLVASAAMVARQATPIDEGKGTAFKSKTFTMKEKDEVAILLSFEAGKKVTITTNGEKKTDVHLFIHDKDKKEVGKDTSPGPKCEVKFTPKQDGKFKLLVRNLGPGANKVTLAVKVAE
jgi:hypothetical protein